MFTNGPGDLGSIPGRVIPKTQKMLLDASLLNTQHYKVRIKGKVEQIREGVAPSPNFGVVAIEKGAFGLPSTMVANFTYFFTEMIIDREMCITQQNEISSLNFIYTSQHCHRFSQYLCSSFEWEHICLPCKILLTLFWASSSLWYSLACHWHTLKPWWTSEQESKE